MKLRILVISKYHWRTRLKKHGNIAKLMKLGGIEAQFDTIRKDLKPKMVDGRIDYQWFEENISREAKLQGYDAVVFQFSRADGKRWGLEKGLHGSNLRDGDFFGESYVCCDEHEIWQFPDGKKWNTYEKTVPHEIGHELTRQGITTLEVHDFDYKKLKNNLDGFYRELGKVGSPQAKSHLVAINKKK